MAIIELDQFYDTPVTAYARGPIWIRYAYYRSKDSLIEKERGQDYLLFRSEPNRIVFAVCDGVGNSFFGGLGAQIIGESLVSWLWDLSGNEIEDKKDVLANKLSEYLDGKIDLAKEFVLNKDLEKFDNEFQRDAYKNQLNDSGTQTNFVCGVIEIPSKRHPKGLVALFWLGDARLQIWHKNQIKTNLLLATWESGEGWSSKKGVIGTIHTFFSDLSEVDCVIAHTDGLNLIESKLKPNLSNISLQKAISKLQTTPKSDDISFLQISVPLCAYDFEDDLSPVLRKKLAGYQPGESQSLNHSQPETALDLPRAPQPLDSVINQGAKPDQEKSNRKKMKYFLQIVLCLVSLVISFLLGMSFQSWVYVSPTPVIAPPTPIIRRTVSAILTSLAPTQTPVPELLTESLTPASILIQEINPTLCQTNECRTSTPQTLFKNITPLAPINP